MRYSIGIAAITLLCSAGTYISSYISSAHALPGMAGLDSAAAKPMGDLLLRIGGKKKHTVYKGAIGELGKNKVGSAAGNGGKGKNSKKGQASSTGGKSNEAGGGGTTAGGTTTGGGPAAGQSGGTGGGTNDNILWGDHTNIGSTSGGGSPAGKGSSGPTKGNILWGDEQ
jgi:hypothetical protein